MFLPSDQKKNLILIIDNRFDWRDLEAIGYAIMRQAPDILVRLMSPMHNSEGLSQKYWSRPTLTVSFGPLGRFSPPRGRVFVNRQITKLDQYSMLLHANINVPRTARFMAGENYSEQDWGEFVVIKPLPLRLTSKAGDLQLVRTRNLATFASRKLPSESALAKGPALIQRFIDTGEYATSWRVLTLFGEPLYCQKSFSGIARPALTATDDEIEFAIIEPKHPRVKAEFEYAEVRSLEKDEEILAFARTIYNAFPTIPLQGCDILREFDTGKLYAIEINAGGNTWHLSSISFADNREKLGGKDVFVSQLSAWNAAASALIRQTRLYAQ